LYDAMLLAERPAAYANCALGSGSGSGSDSGSGSRAGVSYLVTTRVAVLVRLVAPNEWHHHFHDIVAKLVIVCSQNGAQHTQHELTAGSVVCATRHRAWANAPVAS
jgi:hypothetical protein